MRKLSVEDMLYGRANRYPLAVAVAKRAREITDDILLRGEIVEEKPVDLAIQDIKEHKFFIVEPDLD